MVSMITIISSVISISILLNILNGQINMNNDINKYVPDNKINFNNEYHQKKLIRNDSKLENNIKNKFKKNNKPNKHTFLNSPFYCPRKYNDNFNNIFSNIQDQLPGYTSNDYFDLTRYNNNKYVVPQPINI